MKNKAIWKNKWLWCGLCFALLLGTGYYAATRYNMNPNHQVGEVIDELDGVAVYYNGGFAHVQGRNLAHDGYNLGLKFQCVEFVKRYYYEHFKHKMPDAYGHAKSFFDLQVKDGELNPARGLTQYQNSSDGSLTRPQKGDLVVYAPFLLNRFGHVAIVSNVDDGGVEIIQQNPGPFGTSREVYGLSRAENGGWRIEHERIVGFLRMP